MPVVPVPSQQAAPTTRELIEKELNRFTVELLYEFVKDQGLKGHSNSNREKLLKAIWKEVDKTKKATNSTGKVNPFSKGKFSFDDVVRFVDRQAPLGQQHVFLWDVPATVNVLWSTQDKAALQLKQHGFDSSALSVNSVVGAPSALTISRVAYSNGVIEIAAASRREMRERAYTFEDSLNADPEVVPSDIEVRAYKRIWVRAWVHFRWDTGLGQASLHIGQLGRAHDYTDMKTNFETLVPWLPVQMFMTPQLSKAVAQLHVQAEQEQAKKTDPKPYAAEIRLQGVDYITDGSKHSSSARTPDQGMLNDKKVVVDAVGVVRANGRADRGNCYWRTVADGGLSKGNELKRDFHTVIAVSTGQVHLMRRGTRGEIDYVLGRIRALC